MKQPELGKKIADLRKSKGLTQEELVEKCNLNVRTLQRIEAGEATPRSYTIRIIFAALDYDFYDSSEVTQSKFSKAGFAIFQRLGQLYRYLFDFINLKTNSMKKISILLVTFIIIGIGLFTFCSESKAQKSQKTIKAITAIKNAEVNLVHWLNNGLIDSVLTLYRDDACVIPFSCGKRDMYNGLKPLIDNGYKIKEYTSLDISIGDSIAVEKYFSVYNYMGAEVKQKGMKEWRFTNGRWLIVNQMMTDY